jgi:hypothetical protein
VLDLGFHVFFAASKLKTWIRGSSPRKTAVSMITFIPNS